MALDKVAGKLLDKKLHGKSEEVQGEVGYDMLVEQLMRGWAQGKVGRGLSAGMRRRLAHEALGSLGLDRIKEESADG